MNNFNITTLKNGFKYLTIDDKTLNHCVILLSVKVGSINENEEHAGISHFLEHMPFKATKKFKNSKVLSYALDYMGGLCNASTGKETTSYYIKASNDYLNQSLDIITDMVFNATLNNKDVNMERNVILEEYKKDLDDPYVIIDDILFSTIFKNHILENSIIGTEKTINNITYKDLKKHYNQFYNPSNMTLVIIGNLDKSIHNKIKNKFSKKNITIKNNEPTFVDTQQVPRIIYKEKLGIEQVYVSLSFPSFNYYHKDRHIINIIKTYLADGMSSELFLLLRDTYGLIYSISSETIHYNTGGYINFVLTLTPKNITKTIKLVIETLEKIKKKGIPKKDLQKSKNLLKGNILIETEDLLNVAEFYSDQLIGDTTKSPIINYNTLFNHYEKINQKEIIRVANDIFDLNKINIIIYGKINKIEIKNIKNYVNKLILRSNTKS